MGSRRLRRGGSGMRDARAVGGRTGGTLGSSATGFPRAQSITPSGASRRMGVLGVGVGGGVGRGSGGGAATAGATTAAAATGGAGAAGGSGSVAGIASAG